MLHKKIITNLATSKNTCLLSHRFVGQKSRNGLASPLLTISKGFNQGWPGLGSHVEAQLGKNPLPLLCILGSIHFLIAVVVMAVFFCHGSISTLKPSWKNTGSSFISFKAWKKILLAICSTLWALGFIF